MRNSTVEIIVIEDQEDILELIEYHMSKEGYAVSGFLSTENVEQFLEEENPSLMIVDRNLPGIEGSKFVAYLRSIGYDIPVIFLTARDKESELEEGFECGGDDYMTKPFKPKELTLRVRALLKRAGVLSRKEKIKYKEITVDLAKKAIFIKDQPITLTNLEFNLLCTFIQNADQPLDRDFLRDKVWGKEGENVNDNAINVAINRLKKKIDPQNSKHYFTPVWGVGYKFK
ncbi:MAG: response regulator transcription factor [Campylobacterota bacterium]|nr:response regulator transcription factor [Campylobacterota bacterium]